MQPGLVMVLEWEPELVPGQGLAPERELVLEPELERERELALELEPHNRQQ